MTDFPKEGHPVVERVLELQALYAEEVINLTPEERKAQGVNDGTPRRRAIAQVALERGCQYQSVVGILTHWKSRARAKADRAAEFASTRQTEFEAYGAELSNLWVQAYFALGRDVHQSLYYLGQSMRLIAGLAKSEWYPKGALKPAAHLFRDLKLALEAVVPVGLCPYCKQASEVMNECAPCFGTGILLAGQRSSVPARYFSTTLPIVLYRGEDRPLCEFNRDLEQQEMWR